MSRDRNPIARSAAVLALCGVLLAAGASPADAGGPPAVGDPIDVTFVNAGLSEQCGFDVSQHLTGSFRWIQTESAMGTRTLTLYRFRSTLSANGVVVESRAFGPEFLIVAVDGTVTEIQGGITMRNVPGVGTLGPFAGRRATAYLPDGSSVDVLDAGLRDTSNGADLCHVLAGS